VFVAELEEGEVVMAQTMDFSTLCPIVTGLCDLNTPIIGAITAGSGILVVRAFIKD
jgi:hypothetical protein